MPRIEVFDIIDANKMIDDYRDALIYGPDLELRIVEKDK